VEQLRSAGLVGGEFKIVSNKEDLFWEFVAKRMTGHDE
jgi:hypothetical protein